MLSASRGAMLKEILSALDITGTGKAGQSIFSAIFGRRLQRHGSAPDA